MGQAGEPREGGGMPAGEAVPGVTGPGTTGPGTTAPDTAGQSATAHIHAQAQRIMELGQSSARLARDPVNLPIIENWIEAIGDVNPVYTDAGFAAMSVHGGLVAPPAMTQVWTMTGLTGARSGDDPMGQIVTTLDDAGFTSVVATNSDHVFHRYLRHGEQLALRVSLVDVIGPKRTSLGEGWFFTTRHAWYSGDELVTTMDFRILKFRPLAASGAARGGDAGQASPAGDVMRPVASPDTAFFWEGTAKGELRIQKCGDCGALRHPPGPFCPDCGSEHPGYAVASGTGEVFSYVVHHHPPVPGKKLPLVIALVELDEGVRVLAELTGARPDQVSVGMPVRAGFQRIDDELTLLVWRLGGSEPGHDRLPPLEVDMSTTFVVASALATRDFTPVHHDRDLAIANGSRDIFVNILTDTGLVERYVSQWAGPNVLLREISLRLGVPCYAGDTLAFSGEVTEHLPGADADRYHLSVTGTCSLGDHIIARVVLDVPAGGGGPRVPETQS
jgi:uncharacterized protein